MQNDEFIRTIPILISVTAGAWKACVGEGDRMASMFPISRRNFLATLPASSIAAQALRNESAKHSADWSQWKLWYKQPAENWNAALPIGNGRLGAMVFGGVPGEVLQLNEDTLWSGYPRDTGNPKALEALPVVRRLLFEGNYAEATAAARAIQGPFTESYLPLGYLRLKQESIQRYEDYRLELDLDEATVTSTYRVGRARFLREYFVSMPDQVLVARLSVMEGDWSGVITMDCPLRGQTDVVDPNTLALRGKAPSHVEPSYRSNHPNPILYDDTDGHGMRFEARARVSHEGGILFSSGSGIQLVGARSVAALRRHGLPHAV